MSSDPKVWTIDIETSPHEVYAFGLFNQNMSLPQVIKPTEMISFAAKRYGKKAVEFHSLWTDGKEAMVKRAYEIVDEADWIVHYNGTSFDIKHLNREFIEQGYTPPSPHRDIDLLKVAKGRFRFASNKLDWVSQAVGLEGKLSHTGFQLWRDVLAGDPKAQRLMERYNKQDTRVTEELLEKLRPWMHNHPHYGLFGNNDADQCNKCGGKELVRRGYAYTDLGKYQQYRCNDCGGWSRGKRAVHLVNARGVK